MKNLSKILFIILSVSFSSYAQNAKGDENINECPDIEPIIFPFPLPPGDGNPVGCVGCEAKMMVVGGGISYPSEKKINPVFYLGYALNKGSYSQHIGLKFSQETQKANNARFQFQKLSLPVIYYWNPTKNISVGGGAQAEMLLNAQQDGKKLDLNSGSFKKYGFGAIIGTEIGARNRGPRLGIHYTQHFGAGSVLAKSYGTIDLTLRVQIGKKPQ